MNFYRAPITRTGHVTSISIFPGNVKRMKIIQLKKNDQHTEKRSFLTSIIPISGKVNINSMDKSIDIQVGNFSVTETNGNVITDTIPYLSKQAGVKFSGMEKENIFIIVDFE